MKNDYLWDKKGGDAEIEGLENLLSGFEYQAVAPPVLPTAFVVNDSAKTPWWKFSLAFAAPVCLLIAVTVGFWATRQGNVEQSAQNDQSSPLVSREDRPEMVKPETKRSETEKMEIKTPSPVKTVFTQSRKSDEHRTVRTKFRQQKKQRFETLTSEEKFAYDQLKLALSITGSKLKVVADTVNRAED